MQYAFDFRNVPPSGTSVAVGNFDGLHRGHMQVVKQAVSLARETGAEPCVLLFAEHPLKYLRGCAPPRLMTQAIRSRVLREAGVTLLFEMEFPKTRAMAPEQFVGDVLARGLCAKAVSCGYNYHFGVRGEGTPQRLRELCESFGIRFGMAQRENYTGEPVSSTRIRTAVVDGRVEDAAQMLGRPFSYDFTVVSGDRRGRLLGFPTINQFFPEDYAVPRFGVYASRAYVDGVWLPAMTNVGLRPTIGTDSMRSETCILGYSGDLYGQNIEVGLLRFLRPEEKFHSLQALTEQMQKDAQAARAVFEKTR